MELRGQIIIFILKKTHIYCFHSQIYISIICVYKFILLKLWRYADKKKSNDFRAVQGKDIEKVTKINFLFVKFQIFKLQCP